MNSLFRPDSVALSVSVNTAAQAALRGIGLVRNLVLAWLIAPAQFGLFGVAMLVLNLLLPFCAAGLYEGVARYTPAHEAAGMLPRFARRAGLLALCLSACVTAVLLFTAGAIGRVLFAGAAEMSAVAQIFPLRETTALMQASTVCAFTLALYHVLIGFLRGMRMFRAVSAAELTTAVVFTLLAVVEAWFKHATAPTLIWCYALANIASVALLGPRLYAAMRTAPGGRRSFFTDNPSEHRGELRGEKRLPTPLMTFSLWSAGTAIAWNAMLLCPMWYLLKTTDRETAGFFFGARMIAHLLQYGGVLLTMVVYSHAARTWEHDGREAALPQLEFLTRASLLGLLIAAAILSVCQPILMRLFPGAYGVASAAYDPLLLLFLLSGVVGMLAIRLNLVEKSNLVCWSWLVGVLVNALAAYAILGEVGGTAGPGEQRSSLLYPAEQGSSLPYPASGAQAAGGVTLGSTQAALSGAAWSGVFGVGAALIVVIGLLHRNRLSPGAKTWPIVLATVTLGFGWTIALPATALVALLAVMGVGVLTPQERDRLIAPVRRLWPTGG